MGANGEERGLKFTLPKKSAGLSVPFKKNSARLSVSLGKKNAGLSVPFKKRM